MKSLGVFGFSGVVLIHMVGVVPTDWPFTTPQKHKLNIMWLLKGFPFQYHEEQSSHGEFPILQIQFKSALASIIHNYCFHIHVFSDCCCRLMLRLKCCLISPVLLSHVASRKRIIEV